MTEAFVARTTLQGQPTSAGRDRDRRFAHAQRGGAPILQPGRNCWRLAIASQATVLIDAAAYFMRLAQVLSEAQRSILIVGWDFDHRIRLRPEEDLRLGDFLRTLVEARPELRIHILIWSLAPIHGPGSATALLFGASWHQHPRIEVRLDRTHAIYACHHQKIVCIDDSVAFAGGMDLTVHRWDNRLHATPSRRRRGPEGIPYPPVHDVQMLIAGAAAGQLARVARERWQRATGDTIATAPGPASTVGAVEAQTDFADLPVALARGSSVATGGATVREVAALTIDAIDAAEKCLYIETQYLTSGLVGDALVRSLSAAKGPEILVVLTRQSRGVLEHLVMASNRDRLLSRLRCADRYHRLRCYYPVVPGPDGEQEINVHSKVMIVDDRLLRIGSANLNNRSMHLDSECDIVIESDDTAEQARIAAVRNRLLAEHLGATPDAVAAALADTGSLLAVVDRLNHKPRGLRPLDEVPADGPTRPIPLTWLLDPAQPIGR